MSAVAMRRDLPEEHMRSECEDASHGLLRGNRSAYKRKESRQVLSKQTLAENARTAEWFDAMIRAEGPAKNSAEDLEIREGELSEMRSGKRSVALRRLLPFLGRTKAILAFVRPLLDSIGYEARPKEGPTRRDILELVFLVFWDSPSVRRLVFSEAEVRRGWNAEQVEQALSGGGCG